MEEGLKVNIKRNDDSDAITCRYLVGADGVKSTVRKQLGYEMIGESGLQDFVNIYFKSPDIGALMQKHNELGMLYFCYSDELISVLVCHDIAAGEFVLQVPYYPPSQKLAEFTEERCHELVRQCFFPQDQRAELASKVEVSVEAVNTWRMEAVLSERMAENSDEPRVFLAGDSAHAYPPSGGFGLNTGIGDAQNLAHKLSRAIQFDEEEVLTQYDAERRLIDRLTRDFAMQNYYKATKIATKLNLPKPALDLLDSTLQSVLPAAMAKSTLETVLSAGLKVASATQNDSAVRAFVEKDNSNSIRLNFANLDFNVAYPCQPIGQGAAEVKCPLVKHLRATWDDDRVRPQNSQRLGTLMPHILLAEPFTGHPDVVSLRQLIARLCFSEQRRSVNVLFWFDEENAPGSEELDEPGTVIVAVNQAKVDNADYSVKVDADCSIVKKWGLVSNRGMLYRGDGHLKRVI